MVNSNMLFCPNCGGCLKYYDTAQRIMRTKYRETTWIKIRRLRCCSCKSLHRELPDYIFPHKQYEVEIITGVIEGLIDSDTLGYENYPCEMTMKRWIAHGLQIMLCKKS